VKLLCQWLGVSTSGFYAWEKREASARYLEDQQLLKQISRIYWRSEGRYGSPRVHEALQTQGISVGRKRVERLMREAGLRARVTRVTRRQPGLMRFKAAGPNLLKDLDEPTAINQVWVADVTYLMVNQQWRYLATVMDRYSRRVVGWSLASTRTTALTQAALRYALKKRGYPSGLILHTDRGIEFTGFDFQALLKQYDIRHSFNRPGRCTDNAHMESFYHSLKGELIRGSVYHCTDTLRKALSRYINQFYNTVRLHSGLGYLSPIAYEQRTV
jgi:transposase InsO family protein